MKAVLQNKNKFILELSLRTLSVMAFASLIASVHASQPVDSGAGKRCGTLRSFEGEIQIFDYTRTHRGDASFGAKLNCGDWISIEKGHANIEHGSGAAILAADATFVQVMDPQSGDNPERAHFALYRGEFLGQAEKSEVRVVTPNAVARVEKGGAYFTYSATSEESQIVGLGGVATLENRYFREKRIEAPFAKLVTFRNPVERLVPEEPRFVNATQLNGRLARIGGSVDLQNAIEKTVKSGAKIKMPVSLAVMPKPYAKPSTVKFRGEFAKGKIISGPVANRAPASVKHISAPKRESEPNYSLKRPEADESEKKRLLQALTSMRADEE